MCVNLLLLETQYPSVHMVFLQVLTHPKLIQAISWKQRSVSTFIGLTFDDDDDDDDDNNNSSDDDDDKSYWNQKSQLSCCLSPTRPNKQRQGLNLYGHLIQMVRNLRRRVCTPTDRLKFHFKLTLFIRRRKVEVRGLELREKLIR